MCKYTVLISIHFKQLPACFKVYSIHYVHEITVASYKLQGFKGHFICSFVDLVAFIIIVICEITVIIQSHTIMKLLAHYDDSCQIKLITFLSVRPNPSPVSSTVISLEINVKEYSEIVFLGFQGHELNIFTSAPTHAKSFQNS